MPRTTTDGSDTQFSVAATRSQMREELTHQLAAPARNDLGLAAPAAQQRDVRAVAGDGHRHPQPLAPRMAAGTGPPGRAAPSLDHQGDGDEGLAGEQAEQLDDVVGVALVHQHPGVVGGDAEEAGGLIPAEAVLAGLQREGGGHEGIRFAHGR